MNTLMTTKHSKRPLRTATIAQAMALLMISLGSAMTAGAAPIQPRTDINPAVLYWQGFSLFPELSTETKRTLLADKPKMPLAEAEPHLRKFDGTFRFLKRAAEMKVPCDWGVDLADGPSAAMPNLVKIRQCANATVTLAHYALEAGRDQDAADILAVALALGRNAGSDGVLVSTMLGIAVERLVISFVAENFHRFGPRALLSLMQQFEAAPARPTVKRAMNAEQAAFCEWFIARIEAIQAAHPADDRKAVDAARTLLADTLEKSDRIDRIIDAAGGTTAGLIGYFKELRPLYDAMMRASDAPPGRVDEDSRLMEVATQQHSNLLAQIIFPNVRKARISELSIIAQAGMLRAAIALRLEGEKGFEKIRDPFGDGPFLLQRLPADSGETGFELDSKLGSLTSAKAALKFLEDAPRRKDGPAVK